MSGAFVWVVVGSKVTYIKIASFMKIMQINIETTYSFAACSSQINFNHARYRSNWKSRLYTYAGNILRFTQRSLPVCDYSLLHEAETHDGRQTTFKRRRILFLLFNSEHGGNNPLFTRIRRPSKNASSMGSHNWRRKVCETTSLYGH